MLQLQPLLLVLLAACMLQQTSPAPADNTAKILQHTFLKPSAAKIFGPEPSASVPSRRQMLTSSGHHTHGLPQPLLPPCDIFLSSLGRHTFDTLGHEVQVLQQHMRQHADTWATLNAHMSGPPTDPKEAYAWKHTWATNMTVKQLEEALANSNRLVNAMNSKVQGLGQDFLKNMPEEARKKLPQGSAASMLSSCTMYHLSQRLYPAQPEVSFLLQYYKRPWIVQQQARSVQECSAAAGVAAELLVNVDNPSEHQQWADVARSSGGFVVPVFSANIHEARGYNRLAGMARGRILVLIQDDEVLETNDGSHCAWLRNMVTIFDRFPAVGIVGMKTYIWAFGPNNTHEGLYFRDPATQLEVQYVLNADYAPLAMRKSAWQHVGGVDETMSEPGECGIFSDWELCTRMWMAGYQVMYMQRPPKQADAGHLSGTHLPETGERCWGRQARLASGLYWKRYGEWDQPLLRGLAQHVKELNAAHLEVLERPLLTRQDDPSKVPPLFRAKDGRAKFGGACPFATGCHEFEVGTVQ